MADLGSPSWSEIDASNNAVPPNGWPEGMVPSDVNNSARSQMGGEKRWWDRSNSTQTTTGTSTAYVLTYASTESALYDGEETSFVLHVSCGATPTLNRDGLGAKFLRRYDRATTAYVSVAAGDFLANQVLRVRYNLSADRYDIIDGVQRAVYEGGTLIVTTNMSGAAFNEAQGVDIASATTTNIGAATGNYVNVTGTTTITGLGTVQAGTERTVTFAGILTLTHNGTSLILPGAANIVTAAGDVAIFRSLGSGNWKCVSYQRAAVAPLINTIAFLANKNGVNQSLTDETWAKLTFGTENFDLGGYYDTTNSRWTPPAGTYQMNGRWGTSAFGAANLGGIAIYKNGSRLYSNFIADANGVREFTVAITQIMALNGTDYVELWGYVNTASSPQNVDGAAEFTTFSGARL
jgi:hypothetical protein